MCLWLDPAGKGRPTMKRAQVAALVAGAALGLAAVTAVVLSRQESREAALRLAKTSADLGAQGTKVAGELAAQGGKVAGEWAVQARRLSGEVARQAVEQYQAQAPRAIETLSGVLPRLGAARTEPATMQA
jgi:hypothetical protein